jgi:glycosyltransferase involved in cell wall biosynthesis
VRLLEGYLPDAEVEAVFRAADVTVLPYRSATQSGVTHVAYALGVPVIITDVGGLAETVTAEKTGFVVPPEDREALAAAVVRFFAEGWAARMQPHLEALRREQSWDALAASTTGLIDALAPGRGWS